MTEQLVYGNTLPDAYHKSLLSLHRAGEITPVPDYDTEQKEISMTFVVENPLAEPMISKFFFGDPRSLEQYRQEMLDGILDFEVERGNWEYTYHQRMGEQIQWVIDELRRNPDSRRAVIDVRDRDADLESGSPACLQNIQFMIRNGLLHCKVLFRSNDAIKAAFMNAFALILLQKRVADELGVPVGSYTHRANSYHAYKRDWEMLDGFIARYEKTTNDPRDLEYHGDQSSREKVFDEMAYQYVGEWDELMADEQPAIAQMVAEQKAKSIPATTTELCSFCLSEQEIPTHKASLCPDCGEPIYPCSVCSDPAYGSSDGCSWDWRTKSCEAFQKPAITEVYVRTGSAVIDGKPTETISVKEFWETHTNDDGYTLFYIDETGHIT
jgi:thymidylate synthase